MIVSKSVDIEQYKPTRCFRCHEPSFLGPYEFEDWIKLIPFDFYSNKRHVCMKQGDTTR